MWIKPQAVGSKSLFWTVLRENEYFLLEKNSAGTLLAKVSGTNYMFRIILKKIPNLIVAIAGDEDTIRGHWLFIESQVLGNLDVDDNEKEDVLKFLELKLISLSKTEEQDESPLGKQLQFFQKTFKLTEEKLITYFSCSLWRKMHCYGWIYITENYICFCSKMINEIIIPFKEITILKKENSILMNGIQINAKTDNYYFVIFSKRDELFNVLDQLWSTAMQKLLENAETTMEKLFVVTSTSSSDLTLNTPPSPNHENNNNISTPRFNNKSSQRYQKGMHELEIQRRILVIKKHFKLPIEENLSILEINCNLISIINSNNINNNINNFYNNNCNIKGYLSVTTNFICFTDKIQVDSTITVTFPYKEVSNVIEDNNLFFIETKQGKWIFQINSINFNDEKIIIHNLLDVSKAKRDSIVSISDFFTQSKDIPFYDEEQQDQKQLWDKYFNKCGYPSLTMIIEPQNIKQLLEGGTPEHVRAMLWHIVCGASNKWIVKPNYYYELLLLKESEEFTMNMDYIDKDLHRSFPGHPFFQKKENLEKLRRVLVAYSLKNPVIGYCQSMNVICALLLIVMSEESAFWLLATICEDIVPEYYSKALVGSIVDQQLFELLVDKLLPDISNHFKQLGISLDASFRIIDLLLYEGKNVLQKVGLAIFKMNRHEILSQRDGVLLIKSLKDQLNCNWKELIRIVIEDFKDLPYSLDDVSQLRNSSKFKAIKDLEHINKLSQLRYLESITSFTKSELEDIYSNYTNTIPVDSNGISLEYKHFQLLLKQYVPSWFNRNDLELRFWSELNYNVDVVDFNHFAITLSIILKGPLNDRLQYCMRMYDDDKNNELNQEELTGALEALRKLHGGNDDSSDLRLFVNMIFDKKYHPTEHITPQSTTTNTILVDVNKLTFQEIEKELIEKPLLSEYLQLVSEKKNNNMGSLDSPSTERFRRYSVAF